MPIFQLKRDSLNLEKRDIIAARGNAFEKRFENASEHVGGSKPRKPESEKTCVLWNTEGVCAS